jgi:cell division protein FtsB
MLPRRMDDRADQGSAMALPPLPRRGERPTRRRLRLAILFISTVMLADAVVGRRGLVESYRARQEYRALEAQVQQLQTDNARLREQARRLREDPTAIERIARCELGLARPGEVMVLVRSIPPKR